MFHTVEAKKKADELSKEIIGAAIEVHKFLGPGLLESAYRICLKHELETRGIIAETEVHVPVVFKGLQIDCTYKLDLLVGDLVIVETKSIAQFDPIHDAQLLTYLRLTNRWLGMLINFNTVMLRDGIKRRVHG